jgi:hypothetical protein
LAIPSGIGLHDFQGERVERDVLEPPFTNNTALLVSGAAVNELFHSVYIAGIEPHRTSSFGPDFLPSTASGPITLALANGLTVRGAGIRRREHLEPLSFRTLSIVKS